MVTLQGLASTGVRFTAYLPADSETAAGLDAVVSHWSSGAGRPK